MDDSTTLIDDSYTFDKFDNRLINESYSLDEYEDDLTNVYLQELTSNERAKTSCDNILHVLEKCGRHHVILNELNYNLRKFNSLKYRCEEQMIYHRMYIFLETLIHEYTDYISGMVQTVKNMRKKSIKISHK